MMNEAEVKWAWTCIAVTICVIAISISAASILAPKKSALQTCVLYPSAQNSAACVELAKRGDSQ